MTSESVPVLSPVAALVPWLPLIDYCAEECRRQQSGELSVSWMMQAWAQALDHSGPVTVRLIETLGRTIEPVKNAGGLRTVGVRVGYHICPDPDEVPFLLDRLVETTDLEPGPWYREYEHIHPFRDGNGRTGKVLYNLLGGTLLTPQWPPDYFGGIANP